MKASETIKKRDVVILLAMLAGMICIIAHAAIWNGVANGVLGGFYVVIGLLNFVIEGLLGWQFIKAKIKKNGNNK